MNFLPKYYKILLIALLIAFIVKLCNHGPYLDYTCILFDSNCPTTSSIPIDHDENFSYDPKYQPVIDEFIQLFTEGQDIGASLSVFIKGKKVIDIAAGYKDLEKTNLYKRRSFQMLYSTSKTICAISIAILVDRGFIKYESKVHDYWPDFKDGNKENVTVAELVQHFGGVGYFEDGKQLTYEELQDYESLSKILAAAPHNHDGEKKMSYHLLSYGHYLNEIVRRVDPKNRTLHYFIQDEIATPLNIDFKFILTDKEFENKFNPIFQYPFFYFLFKFVPKCFFYYPIMEFLGYGTYNLHGIKEYFDPRTIFNKGIFKGSRIYDKNYMINYVNSIETHQIEFPSFNGKSNSYSLAKIAGLIANGGEIDGVRLFKNETINMFNKVLDPEYDEVLHYKIQKTYGGMTYFTSNNFHGFSGNITCIGGGGLGGSFMAWNRLKNFGFSYVMNGMGDPGLPLDTRALKLISSFYNIIENMK